MPIPNELFRPPVVSNSAEIAQVNAWAAGRDVPTLEELGYRTPALKDVRRDAAPSAAPPKIRVIPLDPNRKLFFEEPRDATPPPAAPAATNRPKFTIAAPKTVAPPPPRR